jgi:hypothetical protein
MLAVRIQVIDGARTFTLQDSRPCRLLPFLLANDTAELPVIRPESDLRLSAPRPPTPICRLQHHEGVRAERRQWRVARAAVDLASEMIGRQSEPF